MPRSPNKYKGVRSIHRRKRPEVWEAYIMVPQSGRAPFCLRVGQFDSEDEAARAYDAARWHLVVIGFFPRTQNRYNFPATMAQFDASEGRVPVCPAVIEDQRAHLIQLAVDSHRFNASRPTAADVLSRLTALETQCARTLRALEVLQARAATAQPFVPADVPADVPAGVPADVVLPTTTGFFRQLSQSFVDARQAGDTTNKREVLL